MSDYQPIIWQDYPGSTETPITAAQLNRIDNGVKAASDNAEEALESVEEVSDNVNQLWEHLADDVRESFRAMFPEFTRISIAPVNVSDTSSLQQSPPYYNISRSRFNSASDGILIYRYKRSIGASSTRLISPSAYTFTYPDINTVRLVFSNTSFTEDDGLGFFIFNKSSGAYYCNGVNDNIMFPQFVRQNSSRTVIPVIGTFGVNNSTVEADGIGYFSMVCVNSGDHKITLDFSLCSVIEPQNTDFCYFKNCIVKGLNIFCDDVESQYYYYVLTAEDSVLQNCNISGNATSATKVVAYQTLRCRLTGCICDLSADTGELEGIDEGASTGEALVSDCSIKVINENATGLAYAMRSDSGVRAANSSFTAAGHTAIGAYNTGYYSGCIFTAMGDETGRGVSIPGGRFLSASECIFRGYTKSAGGEGIGIGRHDSTTANIIMVLTGICCDRADETGYTQTGSMLLPDCKGSYSGSFFQAPDVGDNMVSLGEFTS